MTTRARTQPLVQIIDPDFQAGFEEALEPNYAEQRIAMEGHLAFCLDTPTQ